MSSIEDTKRKIAVMQAYVDGKPIEARSRSCNNDCGLCNEPQWNWQLLDYRIAETPDTINWDHVASEVAPSAGPHGWISHDGKNIPVADDVAVIRKYRDGVVGDAMSDQEKGTSCGWVHVAKEWDIVAYKLADESK